MPTRRDQARGRKPWRCPQCGGLIRTRRCLACRLAAAEAGRRALREMERQGVIPANQAADSGLQAAETSQSSSRRTNAIQGVLGPFPGNVKRGKRAKREPR